MARQIFNEPTIELTCRFTSAATLELFHGDHPLRLDGNVVFHELHTVTAAEISLRDFDHEGVTYRVHVQESCEDGRCLAWARDEVGARSGPRADMTSTLLVGATPVDDPSPDPSGTAGPPPPGSGQSLIKVKFRKKGSKPF
jgi:hypothetical protein